MGERLFLLSLLLLAAVCAKAAPPPEVYGQLPGVELARLSPSGTRFALVGMIGDSRKLVVGTPDGKPEFATAIGDAKVYGLHWANDDHVLLLYHSTISEPLALVHDVELGMALHVDVPRSKMSVLLDKTSAFARAVLGYYGSARVDGRLYAYFSGLAYGRVNGNQFAILDGYADLIRIDLDSGEVELVRRATELSQEWAVAADGSVAAQSEYLDRTGVWRLHIPGKGRRTLLERADPLHDMGLVGIGRSPGTVLIQDQAGDADRTLEVALADGAEVELFAEGAVDDFLFAPDSRLLIGGTLRHAPYAEFFDARHQARFDATRKAFDGYQMQLVDFSSDLAHLIVRTDGKDDSGTWWHVDIASGAARPIGYSYLGIRQRDVGPTAWFDYEAADGLPIRAVLTLPPGRQASGLPLVVMPHGGPIGVEDRLGFDFWAQAFAASGYAVLQPNYRGSGGVSREFRDAGYRQWGRKMQTDLSDGVAALAAAGLIDPKRVCIVGASYGGYAALAGVTLQQGIYRCAVSVAGVAHMRRFFAWQVEGRGRVSGATRYWRKVTGADEEGLDAMNAISPTAHAARADAPVLLLHGDNDTVVPIEQSELMASALRGATKPVEFVTLEDEDHWLSRSATRAQMLKASVEFVRKHNPPD